MATFVPVVLVEILVLVGLFLVTAVLAPFTRLAVVQVTEELQVAAPLAMVQLVAEMVPEGGGGGGVPPETGRTTKTQNSGQVEAGV